MDGCITDGFAPSTARETYEIAAIPTSHPPRIGLGTRVAGQLMKDTPQKAAAAIEEIRRDELARLESKSGIRIDDAMQACRTVVFSPYTPLVK